MSENKTREYQDLLAQTINQVDTLVYELENFTTQSLKKVSVDLKFDAVPIIRRLKDAKKLAEESIFIRSIK